MFRHLGILALTVLLSPCASGWAQYSGGRIVSEHVQIRIPNEREWLGRAAIPELERCWEFMNRATDGNLARTIWLVVTWDKASGSTDVQKSIVTVGMDTPPASSDMRRYLVHSAAKEMARLGLLKLSDGAAAEREHAFLLEGMTEILAREFMNTTRGLASAWTLAYYLLRMEELGFAVQGDWSAFSAGRQDLRAAAPGVTFLMTCRELYGRDKVLELFEAIRKNDLSDSIRSTFRRSSEAVEYIWVKKVREEVQPEEVTATAEEDAPSLGEAVTLPAAGRPGTALRIRLRISDESSNLSVGGVFVLDRESGAVRQPLLVTEEGMSWYQVELPIEAGRKPGQYGFEVTAVDEAGNIRIWERTYAVQD